MALTVINNTAIDNVKNNSVEIWHNDEILKKIRQLYAPKLSEIEFMAYCRMGRSTGLNPFLREIWAVKYSEKEPAQIFIGRDGYRKSAQANPDYDYHQVNAVYSNDKFFVKDNIVNHEFKLIDRGQLIAAYCIVKCRSSSIPVHTIVLLKEYDTGKSLWNNKKETMLKKVAEAQGLRAAFQEIFSGTYEESENWKMEKQIVDIEQSVSKLVSAFDKIDIDEYQLEMYLKHPVDEITDSELNNLRIVYKQIKDGFINKNVLFSNIIEGNV